MNFREQFMSKDQGTYRHQAVIKLMSIQPSWNIKCRSSKPIFSDWISLDLNIRALHRISIWLIPCLQALMIQLWNLFISGGTNTKAQSGRKGFPCQYVFGQSGRFGMSVRPTDCMNCGRALSCPSLSFFLKLSSQALLSFDATFPS